MAVKANALHVAIDLGTAFSGFASSMQNAENVVLSLQYPDQPSGYEYCKQPSRLMYRKLVPHPTRREHYDYIGSGFTVDKTLQAVPTEERGDYCIIPHPKLLLADPVPAHVTLPPGLQPLDVITDLLRSLRDLAVKRTDAVWRTYPGYDPTNIHWTITVPASWSHHAKSIMRRAAHAAGIITTFTSSQLQLRSEPEAAAVSVLQEHGLHLSQHDSMLLIDAGGGTVDLSLHEVTAAASSSNNSSSSGGSSSSYRLKELVPCTAELAGASFVDTAFTAYLLRTTGLSEQDWQEWKSQNLIRSQRLMTNEWESAKRAFGLSGQLQRVEVLLPQSLIAVLPDSMREQLEASNDILQIPANDMRSELFDPSISRIISGALKMLAVVGTADYIFLAGGFSENPYLRSELEKALGHRAAKGFWTCSNGGSAVLKGAVLAAKDAGVVQARRSALAYGIETRSAWTDGMPEHLKFWCEQRMSYRCSNVFHRYVKAGQKVAPDHVVQHNFLLNKGVTETTITIFATSNNSLEYTDEKGMVRVGKMVLRLPQPCTDQDRDTLTVSFTFGQTELLVKAWLIETGESVDAMVEFERTV